MDPVTLYDRWLATPDTLNADERIVALVLEIENLADMEGWYHFFLYDHHLRFYGELKRGLQTVGDADSRAVLTAYEHYLQRHSVVMQAEAIAAFLFARDADPSDERDWHDGFNCHYQTRWAKIARHFSDKGIELLGREPITGQGNGELKEER